MCYGDIDWIVGVLTHMIDTCTAHLHPVGTTQGNVMNDHIIHTSTFY